MITIIGIKNCSTMKKAFDWFEDRNVAYDFRDVKKEPLGADELTALWKHFGDEKLINRRGMMWRKLGLAQKDLSEKELFEALMSNQNMMKRPVVLDSQTPVAIGFSEEEFESIFA